MATITHRPSNLEKLAWYQSHCPHQEFDRFSADERDQMVSDDLFAGRSVSMVLVSVITAGMLMAAVTLLIVLATS